DGEAWFSRIAAAAGILRRNQGLISSLSGSFAVALFSELETRSWLTRTFSSTRRFSLRPAVVLLSAASCVVPRAAGVRIRKGCLPAHAPFAEKPSLYATRLRRLKDDMSRHG